MTQYTKSRIIALSSIGVILLFEVYASIRCSIPLEDLPMALAFMAIPMLVVYGLSFNQDNPFPVVVGVIAMVPIYYLAYTVDCVNASGAGDAAFGAVLPWIYGIPIGLFASWITKWLMP